MSTPCAVGVGPSRNQLAGPAVPLAVSVCAFVTVACNVDNPGITSPEGELNFPLVATLSPTETPEQAPRWLYVVNSNFTVRYNSGSLQVFDLEEIDQALAELPCLEATTPILCDDDRSADLQQCCRDHLDGGDYRFIPEGGEVRIPSFASGIASASNGRRLYLSVRSDDSLLFVDVDERGRLSCGQGDDLRCADDASVRGQGPLPDSEAEQAPLPQDVIASNAESFGVERSGEIVLTSHFDGSVSFFTDTGDGPRFRAALAPLSADLDRAARMRLNRHTGEVYIAHESQVSVISRVGIDRYASRLAPFWSTPLVLTELVQNSGPRDVAFHPEDPERVFALVQGAPAFGRLDLHSLYFLELDPESPNEARPVTFQTVDFGPARLEHAELAGSEYLFVTTYEGGSVYIFNADTRELQAVVDGFTGPFDLAIDAPRQRAYVVDFDSSTVRVVDLRWLADAAMPAARIVMTLGQPRVEGDDF